MRQKEGRTVFFSSFNKSIKKREEMQKNNKNLGCYSQKLEQKNLHLKLQNGQVKSKLKRFQSFAEKHSILDKH
jgi:hypothetical protein